MKTKGEVRDTRDSACGARTRPAGIGWPVLGPGEIEELRIFLQDVLQVPTSARRFSVTFAVGEPLKVNVEYLPRELRDPSEETP
jgi:hypothetical protein